MTLLLDRALLAARRCGRCWRVALALFMFAPLAIALLPLRHAAGQSTSVAARWNAPALIDHSVRVLVVATGDAADGALMGAKEAERAAGLLKRDLRIVIVNAPSLVLSVDSTRYAAFIGGERTGDCRDMQALAAARGALYVNAWCDDDGLRAMPSAGCAVAAGGMTLHVAPSRALRRAALGTLAQAERQDVLAVAWHSSMERFGAGEVNARFRQQFAREMTESAWLGWAAVKLVTELALQSGAPTIAEALTRKRAFDAHKGHALPLRDEDGQLLQPLYLVRTGDSSPTASRVISEVSSPHTLPVDAMAVRQAAECVR